MLAAVCVATHLAATNTSPAQDAATIKRGKEIFTTIAQPACSLCHTLADAGSTAEIGVNLDERKPTEERVQAAVRGGVGIMPAYGGTLSDEEIEAVARYVASAASK